MVREMPGQLTPIRAVAGELRVPGSEGAGIVQEGRFRDSHHGDGVSCASVACCPPFLPDHDLDNDVDTSDFGWFQLCLPDSGALPPNLPCTCADLTGDDRIDQADIAAFIGCVTGPEIATNPNCLN